MARYVASLVLAAIVIVAVFVSHIPANSQVVDPHTTLGSIDWSLIAAFSVLGFLSLWGMIGKAFSKS